MILPRRAAAQSVRHHVTTTAALATVRQAQQGRTAAFKRFTALNISSPLTPLNYTSALLAFSPRLAPSSQILLQSLHTSRAQSQQQQPKSDPQEEVRDPPRDEKTQQEASGEKEKSDQEQQEQKDEKDGQSDKKEAPPPPPPHGDKTPWQVFTETLRTEFKASKEWNESTKQLSGSVQQFTESDAVRRAREASEAASKGTSKVLKSTASAIGSGAAWTWETPVVQGIRKGVNATGRGIEKATRPIRETKAFKDVSEAVDDGSSSRYGGWVEKEERRKREEARRLKEAQNPKAQPMVEDPK
jgi:mitochondrial import inner membrane translocase subunit TIM44